MVLTLQQICKNKIIDSNFPESEIMLLPKHLQSEIKKENKNRNLVFSSIINKFNREEQEYIQVRVYT